MFAKCFNPLQRGRHLDLGLELEPPNLDRRAQVHLGAVIDDGLRRHDHLTVARGTARVGVKIDCRLLDRA